MPTSEWMVELHDNADLDKLCTAKAEGGAAESEDGDSVDGEASVDFRHLEHVSRMT